MHYWKGPNGTHFNFNSDLSGDVTVRLLGDYGHAVPAADLLAFANHVRREYGKGLDLKMGPIEPLDDFERRHFVRQAAIALFAAMVPAQGFDRQVMGSHEAKDAWNMAEKLWGAKPEGF